MNLNKVFLAGNLTRDVQLRYTPNQTAVVDFGVASARKWTDKDGAKRDDTTFVDCKAFGKTAETINKFFGKGKPIFVEGRLTLEQWETDGKKRSKLLLTVENFQFVGPAQKGDSPEQGEGQQQGGGLPEGEPDIPFD